MERQTHRITREARMKLRRRTRRVSADCALVVVTARSAELSAPITSRAEVFAQARVWRLACGVIIVPLVYQIVVKIRAVPVKIIVRIQ